MSDYITNIDFEILNFIQNNLSCGFMDFISPKITFLGDKGLIWIIIALFLISRKKYRKDGVLLLIALITGVIIGNLLIKNLVVRQRPCWINTDIYMLIPIPNDYSFPSCHTLSSFIAASILIKTDKRIGLPALITAVLISFSRLYLYVHFPSDVIGGAVLGTAIGITIKHFGEKVNLPYKKDKAAL